MTNVANAVPLPVVAVLKPERALALEHSQVNDALLQS